MSQKMNNSVLRNSVKQLNKATNQEFIVNSFDLGDSDKTQYGLVKKNKDGTLDLVLHAKYTKREIYYHVRGYMIFNEYTLSTLIVEKETKKPTKKKVSKK